jgi:hypothetical protein
MNMELVLKKGEDRFLEIIELIKKREKVKNKAVLVYQL